MLYLLQIKQGKLYSHLALHKLLYVVKSRLKKPIQHQCNSQKEAVYERYKIHDDGGKYSSKHDFISFDVNRCKEFFMC